MWNDLWGGFNGNNYRNEERKSKEKFNILKNGIIDNRKEFIKLEDLWNTIEERAANSSPNDSYVSSLLSKGIKECAKKLGEEAVETSLAALSMNKGETIKESADLLFHLLVLWHSAGLKPEEIMEELTKRKSISGLTEKQNRK